MKPEDIKKVISILDTIPGETKLTAKILKGVLEKAMEEEKEKENEKEFVLTEEF
jgi:hypothetical protein